MARRLRLVRGSQLCRARPSPNLDLNRPRAGWPPERAPSNYNGTTFASSLQSTINTTASVAYTVSFSINQNNITITPTGSDHLFVLSDPEIFTSYGISSPNSTNDILNNNIGTYNTNANPYVSGTLNLLRFRNLYLTSANLSSFTTLGARGESNIINKYQSRLTLVI